MSESGDIKTIFIQDLTSNEKIDSELNKIKIEKPSKKDDVYYSNLDLVMQSPKIKINKVNQKLNKITLNLDNTLEDFLNKFDNKIMNLLSENSNDLFQDSMTFDEIEEIYKLSIDNTKYCGKFSVNINKKLVIYNKIKNILELSDLEINDEIICLLKCSKIIYYKNYCKSYWEVIQIKIKKKSLIELDKKQYLIRDDINDSYNSEEDNEISIKNLKINEKHFKERIEKQSEERSEKQSEERSEKQSEERSEKQSEERSEE